MAREIRYENQLEHVRKAVIRYTCDSCGRVLCPMQGLDGDRNVLTVMLNPDECVNFRHFRDLCNECLGPIWAKICEALGTGEDELRSGGDGDTLGTGEMRCTARQTALQ